MISPKLAGGVGIAAVLAWVLSPRSAGATLQPSRAPRRPGDPPGPQVTPVHAPDFPRGRARDFVRYLIPNLRRHGVDGDAGVLLASQMCLETACGAACFNYNVGNLHARYWDGPWFRTGADGNAPFRAYGTLDEGIADEIAFLRDRNGGRYRQAWAMLMAGDPRWYRELGLAGYYGSASLDRTDPARIAVADQGYLDYATNTLPAVRRWAAGA